MTLRVGTPSNSPFDVRLAWLEKLHNLPFFQTASHRISEYLLKWHLPNSSLVVMRLIAPPSSSSTPLAVGSRRVSLDADPSSSFLSSSSSSSSLSELSDLDQRLRVPPLRQAIEEVVGILLDFDDLQGLLQNHVSEYCGQPPTGSKHCSKLCCFSIDGKCMRPDGQCPYAHSYEQIRAQLLPQMSPNPEHPPSLSRPSSGAFAYPPLAPSPASLERGERSHPVQLLLSGENDSFVVAPLGRPHRNSGAFDVSHSLFSSPDGIPLPADRTPNRLYDLYPTSTAAHSNTFELSNLSKAFSPTNPPFSPSTGLQAPLPPVSMPPIPARSAAPERHSWPTPLSPSLVPDREQRPSSMSHIEMMGDDDDDLFDETNLPPHRRKTIICRHWRRSFCRLGANCNFAHGSEDLAPSVRKFGGTTIPPPPPLRRNLPLPPYV
ncbi:MAG: hypothetical protein Q8P67_12805 [archaeon]|nr:hypothetical protein [archaeon]